MTEEIKAVLDANICIYMVVNSPYSLAANALWNELTLKETGIYVPRLWVYEVTSTLRKLVFQKIITAKTGEDSLSLLLESNIHFVDEPPALSLAAFRWAERLERKVAYDCFYIALAEYLDADLWTSDTRLVNGLHEKGWQHVHELGS
jgi:predicted nucleic acid-binding protein